LALLQDLTHSYPRNYLLRQEIARVHKEMGDLTAAAMVYDDMLARHAAREPGFTALPFAQILYQAGEVRSQLGQLEEALRRYEQAAKLEENNIYVYRAEFAAAGICYRLSRWDEARRKYERVVRAIPETDEGRAARRSLKQLQEIRQVPAQKAK
jgi:tetratricopeptide (TPR) repeat protein